MTGRKPTVSDEEILAYMVSVDAPVVGASEIADEFGYSTTKGARKRLKAMRDTGLVERKKNRQGGRVVGYGCRCKSASETGLKADRFLSILNKYWTPAAGMSLAWQLCRGWLGVPGSN